MRDFDTNHWSHLTQVERVALCYLRADEAKGLSDAEEGEAKARYLRLVQAGLLLAEEMADGKSGAKLNREAIQAVSSTHLVPDLNHPAFELLPVGQRVCRNDDDDEQGVVLTNDDRGLKVKWDNGRTSYFNRGKPGNVRAK